MAQPKSLGSGPTKSRVFYKSNAFESQGTHDFKALGSQIIDSHNTMHPTCTKALKIQGTGCSPSHSPEMNISPYVFTDALESQGSVENIAMESHGTDNTMLSQVSKVIQNNSCNSDNFNALESQGTYSTPSHHCNALESQGTCSTPSNHCNALESQGTCSTPSHHCNALESQGTCSTPSNHCNALESQGTYSSNALESQGTYSTPSHHCKALESQGTYSTSSNNSNVLESQGTCSTPSHHCDAPESRGTCFTSSNASESQGTYSTSSNKSNALESQGTYSTPSHHSNASESQEMDNTAFLTCNVFGQGTSSTSLCEPCALGSQGTGNSLSSPTTSSSMSNGETTGASPSFENHDPPGTVSTRVRGQNSVSHVIQDDVPPTSRPFNSTVIGEEASEPAMIITSQKPMVACESDDYNVLQSQTNHQNAGFLHPNPVVPSSCFVGCSPSIKPLHSTLIVSLKMVRERRAFHFVGPSTTVLAYECPDEGGLLPVVKPFTVTAESECDLVQIL